MSMTGISLPVLAGMMSTTIFAWSALPMLVKAGRSKDLVSYSPGNLVLSNVGNLIHSVYVFSMPSGPIWVLHSFYTVTAALMLWWYVRYAGPAAEVARLRQGAPAAWDHGLLPTGALEAAAPLPVFVPALEPGGTVLRMTELVPARPGAPAWGPDA